MKLTNYTKKLMHNKKKTAIQTDRQKLKGRLIIIHQADNFTSKFYFVTHTELESNNHSLSLGDPVLEILETGKLYFDKNLKLVTYFHAVSNTALTGNHNEFALK